MHSRLGASEASPPGANRDALPELQRHGTVGEVECLSRQRIGAAGSRIPSRMRPSASRCDLEWSLADLAQRLVDRRRARGRLLRDPRLVGLGERASSRAASASPSAAARASMSRGGTPSAGGAHDRNRSVSGITVVARAQTPARRNPSREFPVGGDAMAGCELATLAVRQVGRRDIGVGIELPWRLVSRANDDRFVLGRPAISGR